MSCAVVVRLLTSACSSASLVASQHSAVRWAHARSGRSVASSTRRVCTTSASSEMSRACMACGVCGVCGVWLEPRTHARAVSHTTGSQPRTHGVAALHTRSQLLTQI